MPYSDTIRLSFPRGLVRGGRVVISGSKSQSNRFLLLQAVSDAGFSIENLSDSDDTRAMLRVLQDGGDVIDVGHAGTAMRFGTAFLATRAGRDVLLTGSERMKQRPIAPLVEALRQLGARIDYAGAEGFPPLRIRGRALAGGRCEMDGSVSSQFITALMLISPLLAGGMHLHLTGKSVSRPYIEMTAAAMRAVGWEVRVAGQEITVPAGQKVRPASVTVESDWSSASYYFSLSAIARQPVALRSFVPDSTQGDSRLTEIYRSFGVRSAFEGDVLSLAPEDGFCPPEAVSFDLEDTPDVAQTVAVTMAAMGIRGTLTGLKTLRVKETDRIAAMQAELAKFGVESCATEDSLTIVSFGLRQSDITLETYHDHRMAMAFAPLALSGAFRVADAGVVAKSYPAFWDDMEKLGARIEPAGAKRF